MANWFKISGLLVATTLIGCGGSGGGEKKPNADAGPVSNEITLFGKGEPPAPTQLNSIYGTWEIVLEEDVYPDREYKDNEDREPAKSQVGRSTIRVRFGERWMVFSKKCTVNVRQPAPLDQSIDQQNVDIDPYDDPEGPEPSLLTREYSKFAEVQLPIAINEDNRKLIIGRNANAKSVQINKDGPKFACILDFSNKQREELHYLAQNGELFLPGPPPEPETEDEPEVAEGSPAEPEEEDEEPVAEEPEAPFEFPDAFYKIADLPEE